MKRLAQHITKSGGIASDPQVYKDAYHQQLIAMVESKYERLKSGSLSLDKLIVNGSFELLGELQSKFHGELYLASGTDYDAIKGSVALLGFSEFFGNNIYAAGLTKDPEQCAKKLIINYLINQKELKEGQLLCFGDGAPEIKYASDAGGVCVGVLTPDKSKYKKEGHFTLKQKRKRLKDAGAHLIVPNFKYAKKLVEVATWNYLR